MPIRYQCPQQAENEECSDDRCLHATDGTTYYFESADQRSAFLLMPNDLGTLFCTLMDIGFNEAVWEAELLD